MFGTLSAITFSAAAAALQPTSRFDEVTNLLDRGVNDGVFPGAVLVVAHGRQLLLQKAVGVKYLVDGDLPIDGSPVMSPDTVFDVGSVTGAVVATTLLMRMVELGKVRLDERVSRYVPSFGVHNKNPITIGQVMAHCAGLPHWVPYFEELLRENAGARMGILTSRGAREYVYNTINRSELKYEPGAKQLYSDVGLILMGHLGEILSGMSLERAAQKYVFQPLGLKSSSYIDLALIKRRGIHPVTGMIAPTEECPWRKRVIWGEVHDDNAWAMGGIAGHSGLFSTARDLHLFSSELVAAYHGQSEFLRPETVRQFWNGPTSLGPQGGAAAVSTVGSYRYGWDSPNDENGMSEAGLSPRAVGVCGFTGCSVWIEPEQAIQITLMSNRIHPSRSNKKIRAFRSQLHQAVMRSVAVKG